MNSVAAPKVFTIFLMLSIVPILHILSPSVFVFAPLDEKAR